MVVCELFITFATKTKNKKDNEEISDYSNGCARHGFV